MFSSHYFFFVLAFVRDAHITAPFHYVSGNLVELALYYWLSILYYAALQKYLAFQWKFGPAFTHYVHFFPKMTGWRHKRTYFSGSLHTRPQISLPCDISRSHDEGGNPRLDDEIFVHYEFPLAFHLTPNSSSLSYLVIFNILSRGDGTLALVTKPTTGGIFAFSYPGHFF